jgi:hypothetical protein
MWGRGILQVMTNIVVWVNVFNNYGGEMERRYSIHDAQRWAPRGR